MFKKEALLEFAEDDEKSAPPVFIGRESVLTDIEKRARLGWTKDYKGSPGSTRIIQGAPGAGKSSILAELEKNINKGEDGKTRWLQDEPRILKLSNSEARDPELVLGRLAHLVDQKKARDLMAEKSKFWNASIRAGLPEMGVEVSRSSQTSSKAPSATLSLFQKWLDYNQLTLKGPIIIAIDEAQNLPSGTDLPSSLFLQDIHENNSNLPMSLLLAGLSDTRARAGDMGLTRALTVHSVGRFTRKESVELMEKWCAHFGLEMGAQHQRLQVYCQLADDWPRHLHCALKALAQVIVDKSNAQPDFTGALDALSEQEWMRVTAQFAQYRLVYYQERESDEMIYNKRLTAIVIDSLNQKVTYEDVRNLIVNSTKGLAKSFDEEKAEKFCQHLIHQGALQRVSKSYYLDCPIPSFRTYLIETAQFSEKDETYSIRYGSEVYKEGECDSLSAARDWAMKQLPNLKADRPITLWQGAVAVDILREGTDLERVKDLDDAAAVRQTAP